MKTSASKKKSSSKNSKKKKSAKEINSSRDKSKKIKGDKHMKNSNQHSTETSVGNAASKVDEAITSGTKFFEEASKEYGQKIKEGYDTAKEKAQVAGSEVNEFVKKKPIMALGIALGAGWLIGRVFTSATRKN